MKFLRLFVAAAVATFLVGCGASNPMKVSESRVIEAPSADKARMVFMRSSKLGAAVASSVYDVTDDALTFVGVSANGTKVAYDVAPGEKTFMAIGESADYLKATVEAGKTYYVMVTPRMGVWAARFSLKPVKAAADSKFVLGSPEVKEFIANTKVAELTPEATAWFEKSKKSISKKHAKYFDAWKAKPADQMAEVTMGLADGQ